MKIKNVNIWLEEKTGIWRACVLVASSQQCPEAPELELLYRAKFDSPTLKTLMRQVVDFQAMIEK